MLVFNVKRVMWTHFFRRPIRPPSVLKQVDWRWASIFAKATTLCVSGDVKLSVIDTASVRLNLVGKRVQIDEDAEHFHMETTKKAGLVQVQGRDARGSALAR